MTRGERRRRVWVPIALGLAGGCLSSGCVWAPLQAPGEPVRVVESPVDACEELGHATARTRAHLGPFWRNPDKVQRELQTLARNEAGRMGGNAVQALAAPSDGEQRFRVLRCP